MLQQPVKKLIQRYLLIIDEKIKKIRIRRRVRVIKGRLLICKKSKK
jgi:hypothetical protein